MFIGKDNNNFTASVNALRLYGSTAGFTALEMLISVAIIVLLLGIVAITFRDQGPKNRNAERRNEVNAIANAINLWSLDNGIINSLNIPPSATCIGTDASCYNLGSYLVPQHLNEMPKDPKSAGGNANTGYTIERDPVLKIIIIKAPLGENDEIINKEFKYGVSEPLGDINKDYCVDGRDLQVISVYYNKPSNVCPACDLNGDDLINILDMTRVARNFGAGCAQQ